MPLTTRIGPTVLFFAYCGFVFIASFVGYFLNADRYSRLGWLLFWAVPAAGVLALGWGALAAFIPAAFVGAMIFWRSPRSSFTGSDGVLRDEQIDDARPTLRLNGPEASPFPSGPEDNVLVKYMTEHGVPLTRENYLSLAWPDGPPNPWTAELEAQLPECIRASLPADESGSEYFEMRCYTYRLEGYDPQLLSEHEPGPAQAEDCSSHTATNEANNSSSNTALPENVVRMPNRQKWPGGCGTPFIKP